MKGKSSILSAVVIFALGVAMIIINKSLTASGIVMCGGILFLVASVLNIFMLMSEDRKRRGTMLTQMFGWICSIAGVILGLCMLVFDATFMPLIPYIFGLLLALASIFHFYVLAISYRPVVFPAWLYILPVLMLAAGIWVFFMNAGTSDPMMMIFTGVGLVLFSLAVFIESGFIRVYNRSVADSTRKPEQPRQSQESPSAQHETVDVTTPQIEDVEAKEIHHLPEK